MTEILNNTFNKAAGWQYSIITVILTVSLFLHFALINSPDSFVQDEGYYVQEALQIIGGGGMEHPEHPPLGKLFTVYGIQIFGDNPFGWRIFPVLFGTLGVFFLYLICRQLKLPNWAASLAAGFFAFENMSFVLGGTAMLDVYTMSMMLGGFYFYLKRKYPMTGLFIALSMLAKLTGAFAFGGILIHWLFFRRNEVLPLVVAALTTYVGFLLIMPMMEYLLVSEWYNPLYRLNKMLVVGASLNFNDYDNPIATRPWQWLFGYQIMPFSIVPQYVGAISHTIWVASIPIAAWSGWQAIRRNTAAVFAVGWFAATYLVWIPLSLITDRLSYVYYYYPTIGAVCLGLAVASVKLREWKPKLAVWLLGGFVLAHIGLFIVFYPLVGWWPV